MRRPPRDPRAPILSGLLIWRTALVSALFCVLVFAIFFWAIERGEELEHAQTFAVNAMVGLEIAYLFSVRLRHSAPFDFRSIRVTRALGDRHRRGRRAANRLHLPAPIGVPVRHSPDQRARHARGRGRRNRA